jgi:aromatic ring hydroxylase
MLSNKITYNHRYYDRSRWNVEEKKNKKNPTFNKKNKSIKHVKDIADIIACLHMTGHGCFVLNMHMHPNQ